MVASGLPQTNGDNHAAEIAEFALDLLVREDTTKKTKNLKFCQKQLNGHFTHKILLLETKQDEVKENL